jgi:hypothetical protein
MNPTTNEAGKLFPFVVCEGWHRFTVPPQDLPGDSLCMVLFDQETSMLSALQLGYGQAQWFADDSAFNRIEELHKLPVDSVGKLIQLQGWKFRPCDRRPDWAPLDTTNEPQDGIPCVILTESGPAGGQPSKLELDGALTARGVIEEAIKVARQLRAFVDFSFEGVEQQVCWTSNVDAILALHERSRDHRKLPEERERALVERVLTEQQQADTLRQALEVIAVGDATNAKVVATAALQEAGIWVKTDRKPAVADQGALADQAYAEYNFGDQVEVTDASSWEYSTPGFERTRKVYVETEREDDGPAPRWALTFTARFNPVDGSLCEAYAIDSKGQIWGSMPGRTKPEVQFTRRLMLLPSGRFITDEQGRKIAEMFQPGDSPAEREAIKSRILGSFNALPSLVGVLLRADKEGALWQALYNEGITDAYDAALSEAVKALGDEGIATVAHLYELDAEVIRAKIDAV